MREGSRTMRGHAWLFRFIVGCMLVGNVATTAEEPLLPRIEPAAEFVNPWQDDAELHTVQFVGNRLGWAVGEHGVIWHTQDGGATWQLQSSGVNCALRSICFLTDRMGWIAGGGTEPYTQVPFGVILFTMNGGESWQLLDVALKNVDQQAGSGNRSTRPPTKAVTGKPNNQRLTNLYGMRFFSRDEGVVIGQATDEHPTGILVTEDGGRTWRDVPGPENSGWHAADFADVTLGVVAGARGTMGRVIDGNFVPSRVSTSGLRGLRDLTVQRDGTGWLVGDGGLVLTTENAGLVWQAPLSPLNEGVRETFDFRGVCCRGKKVWIVGQPGSVVWHSSDGGKTWQRQQTGQSLPLSDIAFSSDTTGCAIGALGTILQTTDGGKTWNAARGAGRRLAMMSWHARSAQVSLNRVAQLSGEWGYRSQTAIVSREDIGETGSAAQNLDARLTEAVTTAGGSAAQVAWQFPLTIPGLDRDSERLIADWNRRTENRLKETLLGHLVGQLRMWRPSVLVLDQPPALRSTTRYDPDALNTATDDALTRLVYQAALESVEQAADVTRFLDQRELAYLEPWRVQKVFVRLPPGSTGQVNLDPHEYLSRRGQSIQMAAADANGRLFGKSDTRPLREAYRLITRAGTDSPSIATGSDFFSGLAIPPGSDARRELLPVDAAAYETAKLAAQKQRNFAAVVDKYLGDTLVSSQLIGQLNESVRGLSAEQSAQQMSQLAEAYLTKGDWELAELAFSELVEKHPDDPRSWQALQWLMQSWGSQEMIWRRVKKSAVGGQRLTTDARDAANRIEQAAAKLQQQSQKNRPSIVPAGGVLPLDEKQASLSGNSRTEHKRVEEAFQFWHDRALDTSHKLELRAPALFATHNTQFSLAALHRHKLDHRRADEIYRRQANATSQSPWTLAAESELGLSNPGAIPVRPEFMCRRTEQRPVLDGILSDPCWQIAHDLPLTATPDERLAKEEFPFAMVCYDAEHLYFAASFPRVKGTRADLPKSGTRKHDDDLTPFDRINLFLDVDRDYATFYNLAVDQRGCTAESCWQDASWNPRWFVAADGDETHWRFEVAIPLAELTPHTPGSKEIWNVGIVRTIPAVGTQSWTHPAGSRAETFGWLRFE